MTKGPERKEPPQADWEWRIRKHKEFKKKKCVQTHACKVHGSLGNAQEPGITGHFY